MSYKATVKREKWYQKNSVSKFERARKYDFNGGNNWHINPTCNYGRCTVYCAAVSIIDIDVEVILLLLRTPWWCFPCN